MKKIAILMVLMMGLLALAGCSSDNTSKMVDYTLTTTVTDEATGDPVEGAAVSVDGKKETTNANGLAQIDLSYGEYTVSVSAESYGNASAPVKITNSDSTLDIALSEGSSDDTSNLITNGDFESALGTEWENWGDGGTISLAIENGELVVEVTSVHPDNSYDPKLFQTGIALEDGTDYVLTFDARADIARDIVINIGEQLDAAPYFYEVGGAHTKSLTTGMQTYTIEFTADMSTASSADVIFELGTGDPTTYYIDNISLEEASTESDNTFDTGLVTDGTFEGVTISDNDQTAEQWSFYTNDSTNNSASVVNESAEINIGALGGEWDNQLWYKGIPLTDTTAQNYVLTFDASADVTTDIMFKFELEGCATTTAVRYFRVSNTEKKFKANFDLFGITDTAKVGVLYAFNNKTGESQATRINIDNVSLKAASEVATSELTVNVTDGTDPLDGAVVTIAGTEVTTDSTGEAVFDLTDGVYPVSISKDGYSFSTEYVEVNGFSNVELSMSELSVPTVNGWIYSTNGTPTGEEDIDSTVGADWGSGTVKDTNYTGEGTYDPSIQLTASANAWDGGPAFVCAFTGIEAGKIANYSSLNFKIKVPDFTSIPQVAVKMPGATSEQPEFDFATYGTDLGNGWYEMKIPLSEFETIPASITEFAILEFDEDLYDGTTATNTYLTDIYFAPADK